MMSGLKTLRTLVRSVLEVVVILLMAALVLDVLWQVITRFALGDPSAWTVELARYLMIWLTMLGAAVAFAHREHLGLDYFKLKLHPDAQRMLSLLGHLVVLGFAAWVLLGGGAQLVKEVLATGEVTAALGIPKGMVYLATPIAGISTVLFALVDFLELLTTRPASAAVSQDTNER